MSIVVWVTVAFALGSCFGAVLMAVATMAGSSTEPTNPKRNMSGICPHDLDWGDCPVCCPVRRS